MSRRRALIGAQGDGQTYLYNAGDECSAITGGWQDAIITGWGNTWVRYNATKSSNYINLAIPTGTISEAGYACISSTNKIQNDNYKKYCIEYDIIRRASSPSLMMAETATIDVGTGAGYIKRLNLTTTIGSYISTFDISSYTSDFYAMVFILIVNTASDYHGSINIKKIWLEK